MTPMKVLELKAILAKCEDEDAVTVQCGPAFGFSDGVMQKGGWFGAGWVTRTPVADSGPFITIYAQGTKRSEMDRDEVDVKP
jgi:hypothetical protein